MVQSGLANLEESFKKAEASRNPAYRFPLPALGLVFADARLGAVFFFCPVVARLCFAAWDAPGLCVCVCVCVFVLGGAQRGHPSPTLLVFSCPGKG